MFSMTICRKYLNGKIIDTCKKKLNLPLGIKEKINEQLWH